MLSEANFLLLDEPTNHLDIPSREALESALLEYEGTLLVISHDRYFMNRIADTIYTLSQKGIKAYTGNYDAYLEQSKDKKETAPSAGQPVKEKKENTYKKRKEEAAEKRKVQAALRRAEDTVERLEQQIQELEEQLCQPEIASDYEAALDLTRQAEALRAQHEEQMAVWKLYVNRPTRWKKKVKKKQSIRRYFAFSVTDYSAAKGFISSINRPPSSPSSAISMVMGFSRFKLKIPIRDFASTRYRPVDRWIGKRYLLTAATNRFTLSPVDNKTLIFCIFLRLRFSCVMREKPLCFLPW